MLTPRLTRRYRKSHHHTTAINGKVENGLISLRDRVIMVSASQKDKTDLNMDTTSYRT